MPNSPLYFLEMSIFKEEYDEEETMMKEKGKQKNKTSTKKQFKPPKIPITMINKKKPPFSKPMMRSTISKIKATRKDSLMQARNDTEFEET